MCMQHHRDCCCGRRSAHLSFRDNILTPEVLVNLYCPECRSGVDWEPDTMVEDCGWVLEFDMAAAQLFFQKRGIRRQVTPEFLFDEGYLSWQGLSPVDLEVNAELHRRLEPLARENMGQYLKALKEEWLAHVAQLKAAGWRKAQKAL